MPGRLVGTATLVLLLLGGIRSAFGQQKSDTLAVNSSLADRGKKLFSNKQCNTCHTIGRGKAVGPDLRGVTQRRPLEWIRGMIRTPEVMLLQDSTAQALRREHGDIAMPNMKLSEQETEALIHYLASQSRN